MPEISKITLPSGTTYTIKDETAREMAGAGVSFTVSTDAASTPAGVTWDDHGTTITGTLVASASTSGVFYLVPETTQQSSKDIYAEYVTVKYGSEPSLTYDWEKIGTTDIDLSNLGSLAYKNSASGSYTPAGTVSTPTITVTPEASTGYVAGSSTGGGSVNSGTAASATMPVLETTVSNETLVLTWTPGSFTPNTPTEVVLPSFTSKNIVTGIQSATSSQPAFSGTQDTVTVS